jgi:hypothetical protein
MFYSYLEHRGSNAGAVEEHSSGSLLKLVEVCSGNRQKAPHRPSTVYGFEAQMVTA